MIKNIFLRFFQTFNEPTDLNIGLQNYSSRHTSFQIHNFYYKKKYIPNIEFEKIMSDPTLLPSRELSPLQRRSPDGSASHRNSVYD